MLNNIITATLYTIIAILCILLALLIGMGLASIPLCATTIFLNLVFAIMAIVCVPIAITEV